jgi:hypothetical protein
MASHPVTVVLSPLHRIPVIEACQSFFPTKQQSDINVRSTSSPIQLGLWQPIQLGLWQTQSAMKDYE